MLKNAELLWIIEKENRLLQLFDSSVLTPSERETYDSLKVDKRRREWLAGRILLKCLTSKVYFGRKIPLQSVEIRREDSGAPGLFVFDRPAKKCCITLSHSQGTVVAAITSEEDLMPGVDLEKIEPRDPAFLEDFFTDYEQKRIRSDPTHQHLVTNLIWSAKEAVMKSLRLGMRIVARDIDIAIPHFKQTQEWEQATGLYTPQNQPFWIHWREIEGSVLTISLSVRYTTTIIEIPLEHTLE